MRYSDPQLLRELGTGNEQAFRQLFHTYYSPLCEYASQYVSDKDAEEVVQVLMVYIGEKHEFITIVGSIKSYLFAATKNRCINELRKNRFKQVKHGYIYEKIKDYLQNPDNYALLDELSKNIEKAVAELPENYREAFSMSRFGDFSNKEIAERLGISVKTVEYRISQALKILRIKLKDYLCILSVWL